jgi:autotransporter-associated beta strand protein
MTNGSGVLLDLNNYDLSVTNLSGGGSLGGSVNIGSGTLTMAPTNNSYTFAGGFSGNGNIIKNGIYRLDVGGTSSFTGTTTINDGVLRTTTSTALGGSGSTIVVNSGSSLTAWYQSILSNVQLNGGELEISQSGGVAGNVALLADSTYTAAGIGTISGSISGNHNLTVGGGYYLFLTGNNSGFTGSLTLNSANTYVQNVNALGTSAVTLNGGTLIFSSPVAGNTFANNFNVNNSSNVYVQSGTVTLSGTLSGSGTFNKGQAGALTLSGDNSGFSGAINIANGTLTAAHANALGDTSNGVTIASGAVLGINGVAIGNEAIINNGGSISGTNTASLAGDITLGANSYVTGTGSLTLSGVISDGVNSYQLSKTNTGTVYLTNANTYDGGTSISGGGVLAINNSNS